LATLFNNNMNIISMSAADLNHDGKTDLAVSLGLTTYTPGAHARVATLLANQSGGFYWASAMSLPQNSSAFAAQLSDLDGDGKLDLLYVDGANDTIRVLRNQGNGRFAAPQYIYAGKAGSSPQTSLGLIAAPLTTTARPAIFFGGSQQHGSNFSGYLDVLFNQSK
jgi:hypothetical protein